MNCIIRLRLQGKRYGNCRKCSACTVAYVCIKIRIYLFEKKQIFQQQKSVEKKLNIKMVLYATALQIQNIEYVLLKFFHEAATELMYQLQFSNFLTL